MLNAKEVLRYLRTLIVYDHKQLDDEQDDLEEENVTKKDDLYIKYGHESWQPSFWKWDARKNYSNITFSELKAVGLDGTYLTMSEFFKDVIRLGLEHYEMDPSDHVDDCFTPEQEKIRKKARKLKTGPRVLDPAPGVEVTEPSDMSDHETGTEDFEDIINENVTAAEPEASSNQQETTSAIPISTSDKRQPSQLIFEAMLESSFNNEENVPIPACLNHLVWDNCVIKKNKGGPFNLA